MINLDILSSQCLKDNNAPLQKMGKKDYNFVSVLFINVQVGAPLLH